MKILKVFLVVCSFYLVGCVEEPPVVQDGSGRLELQVVWNNSTDTIPNLVPLAYAKVLLNSQYGFQIEYTGADGYLRLDHLPAAMYSISIKANHPIDNSIILVGAVRDVDIQSGILNRQSITTKAVSSSGIAINEIYCAGPVNNIFYFYDLYLELYNSSDSTKYLDGMIVMRVSGNNTGKGPGADEYNDGRIWGVTYIYKFPGNPGEKNYPFEPKQFVVLAGDAIDHRKTLSNSIDLTNANWEFYNQYMAADIDNPNVPNLINLKSDNGTKFLIGLNSDCIIVASGADTSWSDGINLNTIIDGVQYASDATKRKTIDDRLDRSLVISAPRYSGKSMQRKEPGMDTNDGSLDWEVLNSPTPGRQK